MDNLTKLPKMAIKDPLNRYHTSRSLQRKATNATGNSNFPGLIYKAIGSKVGVTTPFDNYGDHRRWWLFKGVLTALISFLAFIDLYTQVVSNQSSFYPSDCFQNGTSVDCRDNIVFDFEPAPESAYSMSDYKDSLLKHGNQCIFPKPLMMEFRFADLKVVDTYTSNPVLIITIFQLLLLVAFGVSSVFYLFNTARISPLVVHLLNSEKVLHSRYGAVRKNFMWIVIGLFVLTYLILLIPMRETVSLEGCGLKVEYEHTRHITLAAVKGTVLTLVVVALKIQPMETSHYSFFSIDAYYYGENVSYRPMVHFDKLNYDEGLDHFKAYLDKVEQNSSSDSLADVEVGKDEGQGAAITDKLLAENEQSTNYTQI